jgi:REP element-mobilizing transposase RayT
MQQPLFRNGGKRRGAGRKPIGPEARATHEARPAIKACHAMHVTIRRMSGLPSLRQRQACAAIRAASAAAAKQPAFRICHLSIQDSHVHLIVEADDKGALARGMQSFQISAARQLNKLLVRRGRVFDDRYHLVVVRSPTQMRNVLVYVFGNWRKHGADRRVAPGWLIDPYASGFAFAGWKELQDGLALWPANVIAGWLVVKPPGSWLLSCGWRRGGGAISVFDVPGGPPHASRADPRARRECPACPARSKLTDPVSRQAGPGRRAAARR